MISANILDSLKNYDFIIQNTYFKQYIKLVSTNYTGSRYSEAHHIICKSFSKYLKQPVNNSSENLVVLKFKDHCLAHWLLYNCTKAPVKELMANAFISMITFKQAANYLSTGLTQKQYNELQSKIDQIKNQSDNNYWSQQDVQFLIDNYPKYGQAYCAKQLNRSFSAITTKAKHLKLTMTKWWTTDEIQWLKENYQSLSLKTCHDYLGRSQGSIYTMAKKLNLTQSLTYSESDKQFLKLNYVKYGAAYCADKLNKSKAAIKKYANNLGLKRLPQGQPIYCPELNREFASIAEAAKNLGLSDGNICQVVQGKAESTNNLHFYKIDKEIFYEKRKSQN